MLSELERELNHLYNEVYRENYDKKKVARGISLPNKVKKGIC